MPEGDWSGPAALGLGGSLLDGTKEGSGRRRSTISPNVATAIRSDSRSLQEHQPTPRVDQGLGILPGLQVGQSPPRDGHLFVGSDSSAVGLGRLSMDGLEPARTLADWRRSVGSCQQPWLADPFVVPRASHQTPQLIVKWST
jgi:hypothetical protein